MTAMTKDTFGRGHRHKPPRHCTEARNMKVYPGMKIYKVRFVAPFDGFKAKQEVYMYLTELNELKRAGARIEAKEVGISVGDVLKDGVTYRFGNELEGGPGRKGVRPISARVGAIAPHKLAVPPREVKTQPDAGEGADPTEDERREAEGKQPKSKRAAEAELKPKRKRGRPKKSKEDE